jgi:hypothetical protein
MLQIVNGDATRSRLGPCDLPGEFLTWGDILMEGPVVNGLSSPDDWRVRAAYLQARFDIPSEPYRERMAHCHAALEKCARHGEVVLWFEEDWFCQIHLVYLLAWFAHGSARPARLSCICSAEPLGSMEPERLRALFDARVPVSAERTTLAGRAWAAYGSADPTALDRLRAADLSAWPLLGRGVECHQRRFPSIHNGANAVEHEVLRLLTEGPLGFATLFRRVTAAPGIAPYGIGDAQLAAYLRELAPALVTIRDRNGAFPAWTLDITDDGRDVLAGRRDLLAIQGMDRWMGGVRLSHHGPVWRWDGASNAVILARV